MAAPLEAVCADGRTDGRLPGAFVARLDLAGRVAPVASHRDLNQRLGIDYRNANLRLVLSEELLNRLVTQREPEFEWVRDSVLGTPVRGRSWNRTEVAVRLVPDPKRPQFALLVNGRISSLTAGTSGPATFYNQSRSTYLSLARFGAKRSLTSGLLTDRVDRIQSKGNIIIKPDGVL